MADMLTNLFASMTSTPWTPVPAPLGAEQWAHSACSKSKLEAAFANDAIKAIEADILMGKVSGNGDAQAEERPIMAHPPERVSDLSFEDFLQSCIGDGRRHLKLDFKELEAARRCLPLVASAKVRLRENGQAVWLNADILPGPGCRKKALAVPADEFLRAVADSCSGAPLSLGWAVHAASREGYSQADCNAMAELCGNRRAGGAGSSPVVFAACARLAARSIGPLVGLLEKVEGSQLLLWTGTKEPPVPRRLLTRLEEAFRQANMEKRVGYDCAVASSELAGLGAELKMCLGRWCLCK